MLIPHNPKVVGSNPAAAIRPISAVFRQIPDLQRFLFISICSFNCIFAVQSAENAVEIPKSSHGNFPRNLFFESAEYHTSAEVRGNFFGEAIDNCKRYMV